MIAAGKANQATADALGISRKAVEKYLTSIYDKPVRPAKQGAAPGALLLMGPATLATSARDLARGRRASPASLCEKGRRHVARATAIYVGSAGRTGTLR